MSFASQLQAAKGDLTARQVASAVSPLLSVRTVEKWLAAVNEPPAWTHEIVLWRVAQRKSCIRHDWTVVDWTLSDKTIAEMVGVSVSNVWAARRKHAPETLGRSPSKYAGTDWCRSDADIAAERGITVQAVNKQRHRQQKGHNDKTLAHEPEDGHR